jgi:D-lyxose ketol-isomerase
MLKRSVIERHIAIAKDVFARSGVRLPPFACWTVNDWETKGHEADEIRDMLLGWDVTDFGFDNFPFYGRVLFTLRNGRAAEPYSKSYAEKFILDPELQRAPSHYHHNKQEDIINRGPGIIRIELWKCGDDGQKEPGTLTIAIDGVRKTIRSGETISLHSGESVFLEKKVIHSFWGEGGDGFMIDGVRYGMSGEVSSVCNDVNDNVFLTEIPAARFAQIDEDVPRMHYLCREYPKAKA